MLALLVALVSFATVAEGIAGASNKNGNPFGNGSFFGDAGTFSGVMRGPNLTGVTQFTTYDGSASSGITTVVNSLIPGVTAIYFYGTSYVGTSQSVLDPVSGTISSVFALAGPVPTLNSPSGGSINNEGSLVNDAFLLHGSFVAQLKNSYPNQSFNGTGQVTLNDASIGQTNGQGQVNNNITTGPAVNGASATFSIYGSRISSSQPTYQ